MKKFLRILWILIILIAAFFVIKTQTTRFGSTPTTMLANPASVYCEQQSGTLEIVTDASGAQSGICHLVDGKTCDEWAYFRGECPGTGNEVTWNLNTQSDTFQSLWLSFDLPSWWVAKEDITNPCMDNGCPINVLRITTNIKDNSGYAVYALLKIDLLDKSFKNAQMYIDSFPNEQNILVNQPERKLVQLDGTSGYGSFVLNVKWEYFLIEIFDFTSDQPMPKGYDDIWTPYTVTKNDINNVINIIKSITK